MSWKRRIAFILIDMGIALAFAGAGIAMIIIVGALFIAENKLGRDTEE